MIRTEAQLKEKLEELSKLGAPQLRAEWTAIYGTPAPRRISRDILLRGIAYRLQERMWGGLKPTTIRRLKRLAGNPEVGSTTEQPAPIKLNPGVRLLREWKGETQIVEVLPDGFAWRGAKYRSLSVIARAITGVQWSGPKFFGLLDKKREITADPEALVAGLKR